MTAKSGELLSKLKGFSMAAFSSAAPGLLMVYNGADPIQAVIGYGICTGLVLTGTFTDKAAPAIIGTGAIAGGSAAVYAASMTHLAAHQNMLSFTQAAGEGMMTTFATGAAAVLPLVFSYIPTVTNSDRYNFKSIAAGTLAGAALSASAGHMLATTNPEKAPILEGPAIRNIQVSQEKPGNMAIGGYVFSAPSAA